MFIARFDPIATGSDWTLDIEISDSETGDPIDLDGVLASVAISRRGCESVDIRGSSDDGKISFPDNGIVHIAFTASNLSRLSHGEYDVGITFERDGQKESIILGVLPVIDGVVTR